MPPRRRPSWGRFAEHGPKVLVGKARRRQCTTIVITCLGIAREAASWRFPSLFWVPPTLDALDDDSPLNITVNIGKSVGGEWLDSLNNLPLSRNSIDEMGTMTPPLWDSGQCMEIHGTPKLQTEVDPGGYLVFTEGREQLGNNRILISDGLVIAKALNRTLVEFPMANSRIARPDAERGMCQYWDCGALCSYHRVLDLWTFRSMLATGTVSDGGFLEIESANWEQRLLPSLVTMKNITDYFEEYREAQVIVLKMAWKSGLEREPLEHLWPNPFYKQAVRSLVSQQKASPGFEVHRKAFVSYL